MCSSDLQPATPISKKATKDPRTRLICVNDPTTGSMIPKKTCHTQEDWDSVSRDGAAQASELRREQELMQSRQN